MALLNTSGADRDLEMDVAIVGYGPVGQALAALLGRAGHRVVVFERFQDIYRLPRAVHLDHEIMRLLQSLDLADVLADELVPVHDYQWFGADGEPVLRFDRDGPRAVRVGGVLHVLPARARGGDPSPCLRPGRGDRRAGVGRRSAGGLGRPREAHASPGE